MKPLRILVIYWNYENRRSSRITIFQHLHTLDHSTNDHQVLYWNAFSAIPPTWLKKLNLDAIILHYSLLGLRTDPGLYEYIQPRLHWLSDIACVKVAIPQDEYDRCGVLDKWLQELKVNIVFSCFEEQNQKILYPLSASQVDFYYCFTGYIDEKAAQKLAKKATPIQSRTLDIVYRARNLPFWYGSHGQLKHRIADIVSERAKNHGFHCDISTRPEDTIVGDQWITFLASGKAVIGIESGLSTKDPYGNIKETAQKILKENPDITFEEMSRQMPLGWDSYHFLAISPRHFDVVITKTCQLLVEGFYSGVLKANQHYIALKPDFSNLDEALEKLKDIPYVQSMVDQAYEEVYLSHQYTYQQFATMIEGAIVKKQQELGYESQSLPYLLWLQGNILAYFAEIKSLAYYYMTAAYYRVALRLKDLLGPRWIYLKKTKVFIKRLFG